MTSVFEPFDLEKFRAFVAGKPAEETYDACNSKACALGQFGLRGVIWPHAQAMGMSEPLYDAITCERPFTFGALLDRLNTLTPAPSHE